MQGTPKFVHYPDLSTPPGLPELSPEAERWFANMQIEAQLADGAVFFDTYEPDQGELRP